MRLLLISVKSAVSYGGIATWTERFLANCEGHGISCDLVNTEMVGRRALREDAERNFRDEYIRTCRIFRNLKGFLGNKHYDAAHLNTSCGPFGLFRDYLIAKRVKKKGIRLIVHFHCDIPYWVRNYASRRCLRKLLALSDERLVLCESSRRYLEKDFGVSSHKIPNFLDDTVIRCDEKPIETTLSTALFIGRVSEAKGARELFELAKRMPHIEFRLGGGISNVVSTWEKPKNVTLVGGMPYSAVFAEMDKADIFVFPSHSEGFSLALAEAMARGLPVVATDVGAAADMLADGCGLLTAVSDVEGMIAAINGLADKNVRGQISRCAVEKARTQYTTDIILKELKEYYQEDAQS